MTAESCTGGLIASLLVSVPGCGEVLDRGYVVYRPKAKHECLGVSYETIEEYGLSSRQVAEEMALGALANSSASVSVSTTGLAEVEGELGGVVYFGWAARLGANEYIVTAKVKFPGSRNEVREAAAHHALGGIPIFLKDCWNNSLPYRDQRIATRCSS